MLIRTRKWGNSLAVIIPRKTAETLRLKPNDEVDLKVEKKANVLKEMFGSIHFSKPVEQLLKEAREKTSKWD